MKYQKEMIVVFLFLSLMTGPFTSSAHENEGDSTSHFQMRYLIKGDKAPDFDLTDENGAEFGLKDLKGKPVFITFIYSSCPDVCPSILKDLDKIEDKLWWWRRNKMRHLAITVDPEVDTPPVLKEYAKALGLDTSKVHLLTGKPEIIKKVLSSYGIATFKDKETGSVGHPLLGYLIDENGIVENVIRLTVYIDNNISVF